MREGAGRLWGPVSPVGRGGGAGGGVGEVEWCCVCVCVYWSYSGHLQSLTVENNHTVGKKNLYYNH